MVSIDYYFLIFLEGSSKTIPNKRRQLATPTTTFAFCWLFIKGICNISKHYSNKSRRTLKLFPVSSALLSNVFHCRNNYGLNLFFSRFPPCLAFFSHLPNNLLSSIMTFFLGTTTKRE